MIITKPILNIILSVSLMLPVTMTYADSAQDSALLEAAEKGNLSAMRAAIEGGADINVKDAYQEDSPLISAAKRGHAEIAKELITKGAGLNAIDRHGATALMHASAEGYADIARTLIDGAADINIRDKYGRTALMSAAANNQPDIVRLLLSKGAEVNAEDALGRTAWVLALKEGNNEIAGFLKKSGAKEKYEALEWAGEYCSKEGPSELIVESIAQLGNLWESLSSNGPLPKIDFNKYVIAAVFLGVRPTGGYDVKFGKPYQEEGKIIIPYEEIKPTLGQFATQAFTQPYRMKVLQKNGEIVLRKNQAEDN